jgi:hypothetical protein
VHRAVADLFNSLHEGWVCAWPRAKNKGMKAAASLQIPTSRFDDAVHEVWMSATAMRKVTWEARAMASTSECTNHLASEGATLDGVDASRSSSSSYGGRPRA